MNPFLISAADFFLPRSCYRCGIKLLPYEELFCLSCRPEITTVSRERLIREYDRKFKKDKIISGYQSLFIFENEGAIQKIIHQLKYANGFLLGKRLGKFVGRQLKDKIESWNADIIIPVPLHSLRKAERGYNQSDFIAKGIASIHNLPVKTNLVSRRRYTSTQTAFNLEQRKVNIKDAFLLRKPEQIKNKRIILVDDVITTGATITECGKLLLDNYAEEVFAVSAALAD